MHKEIELLAPKAEKEYPVIHKGIDITKLDFPQLCTFWHDGRKAYGVLNKTWEDGKDVYQLHHLIRRQENTELSGVTSNPNLKQLLDTWDVEFKSGKVIVYE